MKGRLAFEEPLLTAVQVLDGLGDTEDGVAACTGNTRILIQFFQLTCFGPEFIKCE
jgi:hypothetical protein